MRHLYLASGNAHKLSELRDMAETAKADLRIDSAEPLGGMPDVVEDAGTFEGNARKKAIALAALLPEGTWALADDSGLCVEALDGAPGVHSARYAGVQAGDAENNAKLLTQLGGKTVAERQAKFVCVLVLRNKAGAEFVFEGECRGSIALKPSGGNGFGYDPLFVPEGFDRTYAELGDTVKQRLSHRSVAFFKLIEGF